MGTRHCKSTWGSCRCWCCNTTPDHFGNCLFSWLLVSDGNWQKMQKKLLNEQGLQREEISEKTSKNVQTCCFCFSTTFQTRGLKVVITIYSNIPNSKESENYLIPRHQGFFVPFYCCMCFSCGKKWERFLWYLVLSSWS